MSLEDTVNELAQNYNSRANSISRLFCPGDIITVAGEDFLVESDSFRLRNIRNLQQLEDITDITGSDYGPVKQR